MSEFKDKVDLFDLEKDGVYYKKLAGNCLMVLRRIGYSSWWKTAKHVSYDTYSIWKSYSNIAIPKEVNGMKVVSVECNEYGYSSAEIKNVSFPDTINSFGKELGYISNVVFPDSVIDSHYESVVGCNDISIPKSVRTIGRIQNCNNITIPSPVRTIGDISSCNNIALPGSVQTIGDIYHCDNLTVPDSVQTIGRISNCNMLIISKSVVSVKKIDNWGPSILKIDNPNPPVLTECDEPHNGTVIFIPLGSLGAYKNDPMWGKFKTIREDPTLGKGAVSPQPQAPAAINGNTEKEKVELKSQLAKKDEEIAELKRQLAQRQEEIAELKNQLAKKDEEIAELKRQSESKKASAEPKPQPAPAQPKPIQPSAPTNATAAVPKANGVFKLADYKSKGKLCHTIVKTYVEQHPDVTLAQLKQAFNVPKCEVVESLAVALTIKDSTGKVGGDYYIKENDQLKAKDGMVVVWSYWPERFYNPFMERVKTLGYTIE